MNKNRALSNNNKSVLSFYVILISICILVIIGFLLYSRGAPFGRSPEYKRNPTSWPSATPSVFSISKWVGACENVDNFENDNSNKWMVLLTMCVDRFKKGDEDDMEQRTQLYRTQLQKWLEKTNLPIFAVESSNNANFLKEIADKNERLTYYVFDPNEAVSSSVGEIKSLQYALQNMKENDIYNRSSHILKITGRYYLDDFENKANALEQGKDLYIQKHRATNFQNSEYFGMKKDVMNEFVDNFDMSILMEDNLYKFSLNKEYVVFDPFDNNVARGGDNLVLQKL